AHGQFRSRQFCGARHSRRSVARRVQRARQQSSSRADRRRYPRQGAAAGTRSGAEDRDDADVAGVECRRCGTGEPSGGARLDRRSRASPATYAAPFWLASRIFFLLLLAASRANRSARKRAVFSRVACSCAWYSAMACWASRNCCSFLNNVSARRRASSVFTLTIGTPCKALEDRGLSICHLVSRPIKRTSWPATSVWRASLRHASSE